MVKEVNAHITVAKLAVEMANQVYELLAKDNAWYKRNRSRRAFVMHCAPSLHQEARRTLAEMLTRHDVSDHDKNQIYDALILDNAIPKGSKRTVLH